MKKLFESYEDFDAQTISSYVKGYVKHVASKKFDTMLDFLEDLNEYLEPLNIDIRDEMGHSGINWVTPNIAYAALREDGRITIEIGAQQIFEDLVWDYENNWSVEKDTDFNQFLKELGHVIIHECVHVRQYSKGYPNKSWKDTDPNEVGMYKYLSNKDEIAAHSIAAVQEALDIGYSLSEILEKLTSLESAEDMIEELDCVRDYAMFFNSDDPRDIKVIKQLTKTIANEALKRKRLGENLKLEFFKMKTENIYDKHLQTIEEAEERVHIAKLNLQEAEKELDETLELVEAFLIGDGKFAIEVKEFNELVKQQGVTSQYNVNNENNFTWSLIGEDGKIDNKEPKEFENKKEAEKFVKEKKLRSDYKDVRIVSAKDINR